jgi:hypothetical protein
VSLHGSVPVELRRGAEVRAPGSVPAGNWEVWADFGHGFVRSLALELAEGGSVAVQCSRITFTCKVER